MGAAAAGPHEGGEVMLPQEVLEGRRHQALIEPALVAVPAPGAEEQVGNRAVVEGVAVSAIAGGEAGVPAGGHLPGGPHPDAGGQAAIEGGCPALGWNRTGHIEMDHLAGRMHAAVGAAGGHRRGGPVGVELGNRPLQGLLDAGVVGLALPAAVGAAVVLQADGDAPGARCCCAGLAVSGGRRTGPRAGAGWTGLDERGIHEKAAMEVSPARQRVGGRNRGPLPRGRGGLALRPAR